MAWFMSSLRPLRAGQPREAWLRPAQRALPEKFPIRPVKLVSSKGCSAMRSCRSTGAKVYHGIQRRSRRQGVAGLRRRQFSRTEGCQRKGIDISLCAYLEILIGRLVAFQRNSLAISLFPGQVVVHALFSRLLPFLRWFPMSRAGLRTDLVAGITVALVLVPQSMAYAQLAGLPVVYGLYASFVPVIIASLWGSSSQLHTGPVAMLSLMSAAALIPFANPGSDMFIELSVMLALMVGVLRLTLGVLSLGAVVNLLSSPVIVGFTNAAALIIGLSQLSKVLGVPFPRTESYLADLWRVIRQVPDTHWPTLGFAVGAWLLIAGLRRYRPRLPGVLFAVLVATVISALIGFEHKVTVKTVADRRRRRLSPSSSSSTRRRSAWRRSPPNWPVSAVSPMSWSATAAWMRWPGRPESAPQVPMLEFEQAARKRDVTRLRVELHHVMLQDVEAGGRCSCCSTSKARSLRPMKASAGGLQGVQGRQVTLSAGGDVVGVIPEGLPSLEVPTVHWDLVLALLPAALVMALIGFMEATSISKAIATSTGERVEANKELIGQGLANIAGSFFSAFTVSGSFSRSAVAARSGAKTGLFAIVSAFAVVLVLLFFTEYLYHLPQAVLAVIVMMAVFSLIRDQAPGAGLGGRPCRRADRCGHLPGHAGDGPGDRQRHPAGRLADGAAFPDPHDEAARGHCRPQAGRHPRWHTREPPDADERTLRARAF